MLKESFVYAIPKDIRGIFKKPVTFDHPACNQYSVGDSHIKKPQTIGKQLEKRPVRDLNTKMQPNFPGPGTYTVQESQYKNKKGTFLGTMNRHIDHHKAIPGPGAYTITDKPNICFKAPQLKEKGKNLKQLNVPGPGTYQPKISYTSQYKKKNQRIGQSANKTRDGAYYNSYYCPNKIPGPGDYFIKPKKQPCSSVFGKTTSRRELSFNTEWQKYPSTSPGPAAYDHIDKMNRDRSQQFSPQRFYNSQNLSFNKENSINCKSESQYQASGKSQQRVRAQTPSSERMSQQRYNYYYKSLNSDLMYDPRESVGLINLLTDKKVKEKHTSFKFRNKEQKNKYFYTSSNEIQNKKNQSNSVQKKSSNNNSDDCDI